jgi:hypothetical protein
MPAVTEASTNPAGLLLAFATKRYLGHPELLNHPFNPNRDICRKAEKEYTEIVYDR